MNWIPVFSARGNGCINRWHHIPCPSLKWIPHTHTDTQTHIHTNELRKWGDFKKKLRNWENEWIYEKMSWKKYEFQNESRKSEIVLRKWVDLRMRKWAEKISWFPKWVEKLRKYVEEMSWFPKWVEKIRNCVEKMSRFPKWVEKLRKCVGKMSWFAYEKMSWENELIYVWENELRTWVDFQMSWETEKLCWEMSWFAYEKMSWENKLMCMFHPTHSHDSCTFMTWLMAHVRRSLTVG